MKRATIIVFLMFSSNCFASSTDAVEVLDNKSCNKSYRAIKGTNFSIQTFCEGALGKYIGIIHSGELGVPQKGPWELDKRYWQESSWSKDVTSFFVSPNKRFVYIATSSTYGAGGIYKLNLQEKKSFLVVPKTIKEVGEGSYTLTSYHNKKKLLTYKTESDGKLVSRSIKVD